jgi:simple sugar transport system substrate-binding protein
MRLFIALLLLSTLILAACGNTPQTSPEATAPDTTTEEAADTDTSETDTETEATEDMAGNEEADTEVMTDTEANGSEEADIEETDTEETTAETSGDPFIFGMVLVGPHNDAGWSQAHYEGAKYAEEQVPGTKFIYVDKVNPADRPNMTTEQVVDDLIAQGAEFIITNSDDFKEGTHAAAEMHPDIPFIHVSGDGALTGEAPDNVGNIMGKMIYGKMMAGCAAALQSETGYISYLGPLINDETRRLVNAAYLGAAYCNETLRAEPFEELQFEVVWIGFWFNVPGLTLDPTQVANNFINAGSDVIISGIDTTEALVEAGKASEAGETVYAVPYDYLGACEQAPDICLGVPYFNWGPAYMEQINDVMNGTWESTWEWLEPDWDDLNNLDTSAIGFLKGDGLSEENQTTLDTFIAGLADESIQLFVGPLNFQDGSEYLAEGEVATDEQIWYMPQLLEGIEGQSSPEE